MLGERIREIRKKKKMTLEELAGEELTKGMLSLIENNKANPSMESLTYIAKRLDVEVTDLLEEISMHELRETLDKAEELFNVDVEKMTDKYKQLILLIEPFVPNLTQGYESARLLDIYSRSLFREKITGWEVLSNKAAKMYDQMNLTAKRASIGIFWAMVKFIEHDYSQSLQILVSERQKIESNHAYIDPMTRVDFDYHEAILHFAVGDSEAAARVMEEGIHFSKEHRIFYRIDDLYRLAAVHAEMTHNKHEKSHYLLKLKQYGEFADDLQSILAHDLFHVLSLISEKREYVNAIEISDKYLASPTTLEIYCHLFRLEKGKALYCLSRFQEAIDCLENVSIPPYIHHPIDLSLLYVKDSYIALSHFELGNVDTALQIASIAVESFNPLPPTPYKDFAKEAQKKINAK
ncbi:helix-turn-helix domain-containing protein [Neobacillus vireti]|uniref:DNA-binding protein n=1 Tax=Neobacillus vireti LMG 21834 TaxID=1131730 RepID=A0AB94IUG2_9BACI|nr:helix-turn-helix transcriptional regulator [Neobacillus vireti]ETI70729.1 DNA-binding protein [Neobacillus vireti LMG 21834]KLT18787.1 DNA-binding protein [Neobacillus vireti]